MTTELIAKVKRDVLGSKVVAYWDFGEIPILGKTKAECPFCKCSFISCLVFPILHWYCKPLVLMGLSSVH